MTEIEAGFMTRINSCLIWVLLMKMLTPQIVFGLIKVLLKHPMSLRVSVVIRHKFHLRYSCCSDGGPLVFENRQPMAARASCRLLKIEHKSRDTDLFEFIADHFEGFDDLARRSGDRGNALDA